MQEKFIGWDSKDLIKKKLDTTSNAGAYLLDSMNSASDWVKKIVGHKKWREHCQLGHESGNTRIDNFGISDEKGANGVDVCLEACLVSKMGVFVKDFQDVDLVD